MKCLIQRVSEAKVVVEGSIISSIGFGLLVFIAFEKNDNESMLVKMKDKILNYRIFSDNLAKANRSIIDVKGDILLVSQFTLSANTHKGLRPSFSNSMPHKIAQKYYEKLSNLLKNPSVSVELGLFGANMQVILSNDGPATYWIDI